MNSKDIPDRTFLMIKPEGVKRGLVGKIIKRFEERGYILKYVVMVNASRELIEKHYVDLVDKSFFPSLLEHMISGPVVCTVWEGKDAVRTFRKMIGVTDPLECDLCTIRGDYAIELKRNWHMVGNVLQ